MLHLRCLTRFWIRHCRRFNSFMHNFVKWPNILQKSCGVHTARFLKECLAILQHYAWKVNIRMKTTQTINILVDIFPLLTYFVLNFKNFWHLSKLFIPCYSIFQAYRYCYQKPSNNVKRMIPDRVIVPFNDLKLIRKGFKREELAGALFKQMQTVFNQIKDEFFYRKKCMS